MTNMNMSIIDLNQWDFEVDGVAKGSPASGQFWKPTNMSLTWVVPDLTPWMTLKTKYTGNDVNLKSESGVRQIGFDWRGVYL
jgi:hypothetical protein